MSLLQPKDLPTNLTIPKSKSMAYKSTHAVRIENSFSLFCSIWIDDSIWHQIRKNASFIVEQMKQLVKFNTKILFYDIFTIT